MDIPDSTNNYHEPFIEQDVVIKTTKYKQQRELLNASHSSLPVKWDPLDVVHKHNARRHEQLSKLYHIHTFFLMLLKLQAARPQQVYRFLSKHVFAAHTDTHTCINTLIFIPLTTLVVYSSYIKHDQRVLLQVEFEVKLPGAGWGHVSGPIKERDTQLNDFKQVHITLQWLILIVSWTAEFSNGSSNYTGKFSILFSIHMHRVYDYEQN